LATPRRRGTAAERTKTDRSLRAERKKSDEARKTSRDRTDRAADGVLVRARSVADAVLTASRTVADRKSARGGQPKVTAAVAGQRARADRAVKGERADADVALKDIRADQADALAALLVHERALTDADLLTERNRSDAAVAHRDDFLGMVAHDIRNLLHAVVLNLELLRADPGGAKGPRSPAAERILRYVARMNRLIGDLLDVTSIDAGKLAMNCVENDAAAMVAEAVETFLPAATEKGVALTARTPPGPLVAELDHGRMLQVLANLLSNAIKFTPKGGTVEVSVEGDASGLRFAVADDGPGIPAAMLHAGFERFRQVGRNDARGHGLGLYISKCIVEAHGGRIWVESAPGQGSRFAFTLPLRGARRRPVRPTASRSRGRRSPRGGKPPGAGRRRR
jgi:signal transduction histidine kinase